MSARSSLTVFAEQWPDIAQDPLPIPGVAGVDGTSHVQTLAAFSAAASVCAWTGRGLNRYYLPVRAEVGRQLCALGCALAEVEEARRACASAFIRGRGRTSLPRAIQYRGRPYVSAHEAGLSFARWVWGLGAGALASAGANPERFGRLAQEGEPEQFYREFSKAFEGSEFAANLWDEIARAPFEDPVPILVDIQIEAAHLDRPVFPAPEKRAVAEEAVASPDFRGVRWFGTTHYFTGMQAPVVGLLWGAWETGVQDIGQHYLLEGAGSSSKRLLDLFRKHLAWGTMIVEGATKGAYRLTAPTS